MNQLLSRLLLAGFLLGALTLAVLPHAHDDGHGSEPECALCVVAGHKLNNVLPALPLYIRHGALRHEPILPVSPELSVTPAFSGPTLPRGPPAFSAQL